MDVKTRKSRTTADRLAKIHRKMAGVTEQEVERAIDEGHTTSRTISHTSSVNSSFQAGDGQRYESVLTRTA